MQLNHIIGNSYFLDGDSAVGVYIFLDKTCLLVDSGPSEARAKKIMDILDREGLKVDTIFSTHAHADHCGGHAWIQAQSNCSIIASAMAAAVIENPLLGTAMLYSAYPLRVLTSRALMMHPSKVNRIVEPGSLVIKDEKFTILDLPGHSVGQLGLINPDGIAFLGDSLMHEEKLDEYPFLYMVDIDSQLRTLEYLRQHEWSKVFLTHGGLVDDIQANISHNQQRVTQINQFISAVLKIGSSREEVVARIIKEFNIRVNSGQYYLVSSTVSAFLTHQCHLKKVRSFVENGVMKFINVSK